MKREEEEIRREEKKGKGKGKRGKKKRKGKEEERKIEMNYLKKYDSQITLTILFWVVKIKCDSYVN
jgi:hypothetical protein